ncbi:MAG TPA: response regulator [Chryseosolibacter sp.]|nr:response regulator [Chryseosolibacter sp.]
MHLHPISPPLSQTAVEVTIREEYLLKNKNNIARSLCAYSLDNGPWHETDDGRFIFRFASFDWFNSIQDILHREHVPCDVVRHFNVNIQSAAKQVAVVGCLPEVEYTVMSGLQAGGYRVKFFSSGKAVIERCWSPVDAFIVDQQSSDIDGLSICRHLRTHPFTKDIPVILLSAEAKKGKEALLAGATDYVKKPFHIHYLLNVIAAHLRRSD